VAGIAVEPSGEVDPRYPVPERDLLLQPAALEQALDDEPLADG
jgi:hypothetical protein